MKITPTIVALLASAVFVFSADKPPDLTGSGFDVFKQNIGKVVTLRGRLEDGKAGFFLFGATPTNVVFYVIPDRPPSGSYTYPSSWVRLMHKQVQVTGELKFYFVSFDRKKIDPSIQVPPDYYYMVLQHTSVESVEPK